MLERMQLTEEHKLTISSRAGHFCIQKAKSYSLLRSFTLYFV